MRYDRALGALALAAALSTAAGFGGSGTPTLSGLSAEEVHPRPPGACSPRPRCCRRTAAPRAPPKPPCPARARPHPYDPPPPTDATACRRRPRPAAVLRTTGHFCDYTHVNYKYLTGQNLRSTDREAGSFFGGTPLNTGVTVGPAHLGATLMVPRQSVGYRLQRGKLICRSYQTCICYAFQALTPNPSPHVADGIPSYGDASYGDSPIPTYGDAYGDSYAELNPSYGGAADEDYSRQYSY